MEVSWLWLKIHGLNLLWLEPGSGMYLFGLNVCLILSLIFHTFVTVFLLAPFMYVFVKISVWLLVISSFLWNIDIGIKRK